MVLETIIGDLRAFRELEERTFQHSNQIQIARLTDASLQSLPFYTADGALYRVNDGAVQLGLTRLEHNLVLRHLDVSFSALTCTGVYHPPREEVRDAFGDASTLVTDLAKLSLQDSNKEWSYFPIPTREYDTLNTPDRRLAERVHGSGDTFIQVMKMLADNGIKETKIYVLNPEYVRKHAKEEALGRASWLNNFSLNSGFSAVGSGINNLDRLRGVRRRPVASVSEPGAHEVRDNAPFNPRIHYQALLAHPEESLSGLDDAVASGLSEIISKYHSKRQ